MSDRIKALTVTLDADYRTEAAEQIVAAIRMLRGVADVSMSVTNFDDHTARMRVRSDLGVAFSTFFNEVFHPKGK